MLVFMIQWGGSRYHPGPVNLLQPLLLIACGVVSGVLLVGLLDRFVPRLRRTWRARRRTRRALQAAATAEQRARALMSELCPHGWRADISVFEHPGGGSDRPSGPSGPSDRASGPGDRASGPGDRASGPGDRASGPDDRASGGSEGASGPGGDHGERIRLRWTELRDAAGTPAVSRELWASTVAGALEAMVADRRTDETLEAIEQGAVFNGVRWPEPEDHP